jgi:hypothetical protein
MFTRVLRALLRFIVCGVVACGFQAQAQFANVADDGLSLTPDPVVIVAGMAVFWDDAGSGPIGINSQGGAPQAFSTTVGGPGVIFTIPGNYPYADDDADFGTVIVGTNVPPVVFITNPTNNAVLPAPATFDFTANASDTDADGLSDVQFYVGTNEVDDIFDPGPFTTTVSNLPAGTYVLMAVATDNVGAMTTNTITIQVGTVAPILLSAPKMVAGKFQFNVAGLTVGKTNIVQSSTNLALTNWVSLATNVAGTNTMSFTNSAVATRNFFRVVQLP